MFRIREYAPADLSALYALDQVCFVPEIAYSLEELQYFIEQRDSLTLVAQAEQVAGFSIVERPHTRSRYFAHLITMDVAPAWRKQGVGSALMRAMEIRLLEERISRIRLEVAVDNLPAQRFYRSFGYEERGRVEAYYPGNVDALVMEKELSAATKPAKGGAEASA
jgi:ribosomal-protein-alanine N-acetyltransferase